MLSRGTHESEVAGTGGMSLLLDLVYLAGGLIVSPYVLVRAAASAAFRHDLWQRLGRIAERPDRPRIWIHCASVGEVNAARPFIDALSQAFPGHEQVVSTYTSTGRSLAGQRYGGGSVFLFPLDFSWVARRVLRRLKPDVLVLVELEFWPNMLREARRAGVPVLVINGRMEEPSLRRWRRWSFLFKRALDEDAPNLYGIQNSDYAERFRAFGVPESRIRVTGAMKYDSVRTEVPGEDRERVREVLGIAGGAPVVVGGSTWPGEEEILLDAYRKLRSRVPGLRLVLAPRHVDRADDVERVIRAAGWSVVRRSCGHEGAAADAVLLIDTIGDLVTAYSLASCAFVGKTLCVGGGHNVLEPAALGVPVLFGPMTETCAAEAALLVECGGGRCVESGEALKAALVELMADADMRAGMGRQGRAAVLSHRGATERNVDLLVELLGDRDHHNPGERKGG